jgi:DNA invertase Pin-like site-specific DNA recombinase
MIKKNKLEENKKKAAIYCRVSTAIQGEAEYSSLNAQEDQLKAYCKGNGWEVVKVYKDIKSGKDLERDEIQNLLRDAEANLFNIVIATKIDRFSRSILDFYDFSEKLTTLGVGIVSATQPIDTSSSAGKLMLDIFLAFAQFERNIISERTREGMNARAIKGFYTGGHLILGYDNVEGALKVNDSEKDLVNRIFNYYLQEPSTNKVSQRLNREGYKTKTQVTRKGISKGGKSFTKEVVLRALRNKTYLGLMPWKEKIFPGIHEAIVDEKIFNDVQKRLDESKKDVQVTRKIKSPLTLLGLTKCGLCGSNLTSSAAKNGKHYYYKCSKKIHATSDHCPAKDLPADVLESCIKDLMEDDFIK